MDQEKEAEEQEEERDEDILPKTRIPEIWEHFHRRIHQIDHLESQLDEYVKRFRRRIGCLLDQSPTHRRTHLRLFVTHKCEPKVWTLVLEGKLLIGLLDHVSAIKVDQVGPMIRNGKTTIDPMTTKTTSSTTTTTTTSTTTTTTNIPKSNDVLPSVPETGGEGKDRVKVRSVGDIEEDPVEPTLFTHTFDKMEISFQTVWQPEQSAGGEVAAVATTIFSPPKKSRKRKTDTPTNIATIPSISPKQLKTSPLTTMTWTKEQSGDAHSFHIQYEPSPPPEDSMKIHSVVATIVLFPTLGPTVYQPSPALAEKFFPKHSTGLDPRAIKRRKMIQGEMTMTMDDETNNESIAMENDIYVPSNLTMNEILQCLLTYITDNGLQDETDKSLILCDKVLSGLLECDSLNFGDIQNTLLAKNLILPIKADDDPIILTYIMKTTTSSHQGLPSAATTAPVVDLPEGHIQQVLSFDMDVYVPSFFHWRAREIMRRYKRREFEYTSSRTKGRYALVASRGHEDTIKTKIGECIAGQGYVEENAPIFLALAKSAPANSEARTAAQIDAKMCALMGRLDECTRHAQAAWELVEDCRVLAQGDVQ